MLVGLSLPPYRVVWETWVLPALPLVHVNHVALAAPTKPPQSEDLTKRVRQGPTIVLIAVP